jgi:hypothetical protein
MSQTDRPELASFFAEFLLPLRHSNARRNVHYLKLDRGVESYWGPVASRTGGIQRLSADTATAPALLEALGRHWAGQGDLNLPKLLPHLLALRRTIVETRTTKGAAEPELTDFIYPLF